MGRVLGIIFVLLGLCSGNVFAGELTIVNMNVGQGDATLILGSPGDSGKQVSVLIDAGPVQDQGRDIGNMVAQVLARHGIQTLDYFVVTHYDPEHLGGFLGRGTSAKDSVENPTDRQGNGSESNQGGSSFRFGLDGQPGTPDDIAVRNVVDRGDISALEKEKANPVFERYQDTVVSEQINRISIRQNDLQLNTHGCHQAFTTQEKVNCFTLDLGDEARMDVLTGNGFVRNGTAQVKHANSENERSLSFLIHSKGFSYLPAGI